MLKETLGHTRMLQWTWVGAGHWFVFVGFGLLFFTLLTAFGQLFDPHFALPLIGHFFLYEWVTELFTVVMLVAIVGLHRLPRDPAQASAPAAPRAGSSARRCGRATSSRSSSSASACASSIAARRGVRHLAVRRRAGHARFHFPLTFWLGEALLGHVGVRARRTSIYLVAMLKILISFIWMIVISLNPTMGVAWHRFTAFFNIWFKREADGRTALGARQAVMLDGKPIDSRRHRGPRRGRRARRRHGRGLHLEGHPRLHHLHRVRPLPVQCPAWNTEKPLSPKLLITACATTRYAKAPYLLADEDERDALLERNDTLTGGRAAAGRRHRATTGSTCPSTAPR